MSNFKFHTQLASNHTSGNILFSPVKDILLIPSSNYLSCIDLTIYSQQSLKSITKFNIKIQAISPCGKFLALADEFNKIYLISLINNGTLVGSYQVTKRYGNTLISNIEFSCNGQLAVSQSNVVLLYDLPVIRDFKNLTPNCLNFIRVYKESRSNSNISCLSWSSDSSSLVVGNEAGSAFVYHAITLNDRGESRLVLNRLVGNDRGKVVFCKILKDGSILTVSSNRVIKLHQRTINYDPSDSPASSFNQIKKVTFVNLSRIGNPDLQEKKLRATETFLEIQQLFSYDVKVKQYVLDEKNKCDISVCCFSEKLSLIGVGQVDGSFSLFDFPGLNLINTLTLCNSNTNTRSNLTNIGSVTSLAFNASGDWLGIAGNTKGVVLVYEWASESFILSQQSHYSAISCAAYSQDGIKFATGGQDSKVKVWHALTGFCFKTFTNHTAAITDICFTGRDSSVIVTSSLDGTIRAFDLNRYRNFRTMMAEGSRPGDHAQFSCVAVNTSGELIATATNDTFEVFIFNLRTGKLLERFSGHQAPVSAVKFHPFKDKLISCSWDGSLMIRNIYKSKEDPIDIDIGGDLLALAVRPDGNEIAVSSTKGEISFITTNDIYEVSREINFSRDLKMGRQDYDKFSGKKRRDQGGFTSLSYSSNGNFIYCGGGQALNCLMYDIENNILLDQYNTKPSRSFSGNSEIFKKRNEDILDDTDLVKLPGVHSGDVTLKSSNTTAGLVCIALSPTNDYLALVSPNSIDIWKQTNLSENTDSKFYKFSFSPINLDENTTPKNVQIEISQKKYTSALKKALSLNNQILIRNVIESIGNTCTLLKSNKNAIIFEIKNILNELSLPQILHLLDFIAVELKQTRHLEYYLLLAQIITLHFGLNLKNKSKPIALYTKMERSLLDRKNILLRLFEENASRIDYILDVRNMKELSF